MGKNLDRFRKEAAPSSSGKKVVEKKQVEEPIIEAPIKEKTKLFTIELVENDIPKFETALIKMSHRDGVAYRKKDIYIAMSKHFFELLEKSPDSIKIEKY